MYLVAIAWGYVVVLMAAAEATSDNGSVLGAAITLVLYGVLPLAIALYLMRTPARRRAQRAAEAAARSNQADAGAIDPDRGGHAAGDAVAPVREEP